MQRQSPARVAAASYLAERGLFWTLLAGLLLCLFSGAAHANDAGGASTAADRGWLANLEFAAQPTTERASDDPLVDLGGTRPSARPDFRHGPDARLRGEVTGVDLSFGGGLTLPQPLSFGRSSEVWARASYFRAGDQEQSVADGQHLRLEYRSHAPFGLIGGTLSLSGEVQQDGRGETHGVGMLRLQVPLARIADLALGRAAHGDRRSERLALGQNLGASGGRQSAGGELPALDGFDLGGGGVGLLNLAGAAEQAPSTEPSSAGEPAQAATGWSAAVDIDLPTLFGLRP